MKAKAHRRKEKGNESFLRCEFSDAIQHYSKALEFDATNNGIFLDRASTHVLGANHMVLTYFSCLLSVGEVGTMCSRLCANPVDTRR